MATVGDLFINMKVRKDALDTASQSLGKFVDKSKKQLGDLNQGFGSLQNVLSKFGLPTTALTTASEFVYVLTKGIPSIIKGFTSMSGAATAFKAILAGIGGPITLIVAAVAAIGGLIYKAFQDGAERARQSVESFAKYAEDRLAKVAQDMKSASGAQAAGTAGVAAMRETIEGEKRILAASPGDIESVKKLNEELRVSAEIAQKRRDAEYAVTAERSRLIVASQSLADYEAQMLDLKRRGFEAGDSEFDIVQKMVDTLQQEKESREGNLRMLQDAAKSAAEIESLQRQSIENQKAIANREAEAAMIASEREAKKSQIAAFMAEELAIEDDLVRLLEGQDALEERMYRRRLEALNLEERQIDYLMMRNRENKEQEKRDADRLKNDQALNKLLEDRSRLQDSIQQAAESARSKAIEDEQQRMQATETLDTAIGQFKIPGLTDAVDIQKRIADETKNQTAELRKLNDQIAKAQAQQQAPY